MENPLDFYQQYGAFVATVIAIVSYFRKNEGNTKQNTEGLLRMEKAIENLIAKIDKLIEDRGDTKAELSNHEARIGNLERITSNYK